MMSSNHTLPLVTVIITSFNYGMYLSKAIESVMVQTYPNVEIIVIDDGSTDNTAEVARQTAMVKYFYQENRGLSSARNTGIEKSEGTFLVFLDADDWLEPDALEQNFSIIRDQPAIAFVSGNYYMLRAENNRSEIISVSVTGDHYTQLLERNYIGMHAAVMFQRWVFEHARYDESLKACEDYDLYLTIARRYPILHHDKIIATYYFHAKGLSHNYTVMMDSIRMVMEKQAPYIRSEEERTAYLKGLQQWKDYRGLMQSSRS